MTINAKPNDKVVLAYSGGLDTSVILKWLVNKGFTVICYCANVGQHDEDFGKTREKAMKLGASKVYIEDLRKEFVTDYIFPAIKANAIYQRRYLLGTALARPVIAKKQVEIAKKEGAKYVAHGATGKGNDQVRFELCAQALDSSLITIAPWRDETFIKSFKGRTDLLNYAKANNIPVDASPKAPYSIDENLYHTSFEAGILEDPMTSPTPDMFKMTVDPKKAPEKSEKIRITFKNGIPIKVSTFKNENNKIEFLETKEKPLEIFLFLNLLAGRHGIGRIDIIEDRFVGIKSRGVYETPGGYVLYNAHFDLEKLTLDKEVIKINEYLSQKFAECTYNGFWFAPEMDLIRKMINLSQDGAVNGVVDMELYKGNCTIIGRNSEMNSIYNKDLASMEVEGGGIGNVDYSPSDAQGFIKIHSTRLKMYNIIKTNQSKKDRMTADEGNDKKKLKK